MCTDLRHLLLHQVSFRNVALNTFKCICIQSLVLLRKAVLLFQRVFQEKKKKITWMPKFGSNSLLGEFLGSILSYRDDNQEPIYSCPFKIWLRSGTEPIHLSNKINRKAQRKMLTMMIHPCKYI